MSLLAMAQRGDRQALEELVSRYYSRLRRIVRIQLRGSVVGLHLDSIDVVQETFQAALPALRDLRPNSAAGILRWLSLIATNRIRDAHDHLHTQKRDVARQQPIGTDSGAEAGLVRAAMAVEGPAEKAALAELRELLDEEVAQLPADQRRVVLLRDYCGEDWTRIAEELGRGEGAARQLHQRAWIRLRTILSPKLGQE